MENKYKYAKYKPSIITIFNQEGDVLLKEPSLLAVKIQNDCILALGEEAKTVIEQIEDMRVNPPLKNGVVVDFDLSSENVIVGSPLKNGTIADYDLASKMFKYFLNKVNGHSLFKRPRIAVCAPVDMTQVEHKAIYETILNIGAKSVLIIEKPFGKAIRDIPYSYKIIIEILPYKTD